MDKLLATDRRSTAGRVPNNRMLREIENFDWGSTPAGPLASWADPLRHITRTMLLSPAPMALLIGSPGLLVYNDAFLDMLGAHYEDALGKTVFEVFAEAEVYYREAIAMGFDGLGSHLSDSPLRIQRHGQSEVAWFNIDGSPVVDEHGATHGLLVVVKETTERVRALRHLKHSQERLDLALNASGIVGTWEMDIATNIVSSDDRFARLFGIDPQVARKGIDVQRFLASIHAEDRGRLALEIKDIIDKGGDFRSRYRVVGADGTYRWVVASGRTIADETGKPARFPGVAVDITNEVAAAEALADSEQRFHTLVETLPQIVWSTDALGCHDYFNQRWREFTGYGEGRIDPEAWRSFVHPDDRAAIAAAWQKSQSTGVPYDIDYRFRHHSGAYHWLRVMALPLRDAQGKISRWFGTATDINDAKMLESERELVSRELNHRIKNLFAIIKGLIRASQREHTSVAAFAEDLSNRMTSLDLAHDFIRSDAAASTVEHVGNSLAGLIRRLLTPYMCATADECIIIEGDDVRIRETAATPLALIFHELATNAAKYGAIRTNEGRLRVRCTRLGTQLQIEWKEHASNIAHPTIPCAGFGSRLLQMIVEGQLGGHMTRTATSDGLEVVLELPLHSLTDEDGLQRSDKID